MPTIETQIIEICASAHKRESVDSETIIIVDLRQQFFDTLRTTFGAEHTERRTPTKLNARPA